MKNSRRSFFKKAGALIAGLSVVPAVKGSKSSSSPSTTFIPLKKDGKITFILDIPNQRVEIKGFKRDSINGKLGAVALGSAYDDKTDFFLLGSKAKRDL